MNYEFFAHFYDELMDDAPYDEWISFFQKQLTLYPKKVKTVLDLACGTGKMTMKLYEQGFHVTGVDLSDEMLTIANEKAMSQGYSIPFFRQDMTKLDGLGPFDVVVIFCDSLNYLQTEEDFKKTFTSIYNCLEKDGLLLFDVHSIYKMEKVFAGNTFAYNGDDVSYIWNSFSGEHPHSVEHELTFFVYEEKSHKYVRFDELHKQRTFPVEKYKDWLNEAGFKVQSITGDFKEETVSEETERIFFVAQKVS